MRGVSSLSSSSSSRRRVWLTAALSLRCQAAARGPPRRLCYGGATARRRTEQAQGQWSAIGRVSRSSVALYDLTSLGPVGYSEAMRFQSRLVQSRVANATKDGLVLVEHEAVYTLGRGATQEHVRYDPTEAGAPPLLRTERGGDVTYHGPGQLVAYPVLHLGGYRKDSHWYLRALEEVVVRTCAALGLPDAERHPEHTGVWLRGTKVAAVGVALRRWVTYHGVALNVCPSVADFDRIVPCGLHDEPVGSLQQHLGEVTLADVAPLFLAEFASVFEADLANVDVVREKRQGDDDHRRERGEDRLDALTFPANDDDA